MGRGQVARKLELSHVSLNTYMIIQNSDEVNEENKTGNESDLLWQQNGRKSRWCDQGGLP